MEPSGRSVQERIHELARMFELLNGFARLVRSDLAELQEARQFRSMRCAVCSACCSQSFVVCLLTVTWPLQWLRLG